MATISRSGKKWRVQVRRAGHPPLSRSFATRVDAQLWARATEGEIANGRRVTPRVTTDLSGLIDAYDAHNSTRSRRPQSRSRASSLACLKRHMGTVRLSEVKARTFVDFCTRREREGAGPPTILMDLSYLRTVLKHSAVLTDADTGPALVALSAATAALRHQGRVSGSAERDRRPTDAELEALRVYWVEHPTRVVPMWRIVCFAIATGMRMGEILRIAWEDWEPATRTILIRDRKHPTRKKGNDQRVPLLTGPATVCGHVVDPVACMGPPARGRVFPFGADAVSANFTRACAKLGIGDLHFHDLRHDAISRLFEAGYDIPRVALVSGHSSWGQLRRYTNIKPETLHRD